MTWPAPPFGHLRRLTDRGGLFEHAKGTVARREHGYCVDDVARALVVLCREVQSPPEPAGGSDPAGRDSGGDQLASQYLEFLLSGQVADGRFHNRRDAELRWWGSPSVQDCWGRALWGLGAASAHSDPQLAATAVAAFGRSAALRSPWPRAMAFAALGAAEVLRVAPEHRQAAELLADAAAAIGLTAQPGQAGWPWPEVRLSYANAAVAEALLAAGQLLGDPAAAARGLELLGWLLELQTDEDHLSVVPVGGWGPADVADRHTGGGAAPRFDQQPIEVAALADACARAWSITGETRWARAVEMCADWFLGANDARTPLIDPISGGGCDGLEPHGRNENQGAESTLALISTLQQVRVMSRCYG